MFFALLFGLFILALLLFDLNWGMSNKKGSLKFWDWVNLRLFNRFHAGWINISLLFCICDSCICKQTFNISAEDAFLPSSSCRDFQIEEGLSRFGQHLQCSCLYCLCRTRWKEQKWCWCNWTCCSFLLFASFCQSRPRRCEHLTLFQVVGLALSFGRSCKQRRENVWTTRDFFEKIRQIDQQQARNAKNKIVILKKANSKSSKLPTSIDKLCEDCAGSSVLRFGKKKDIIFSKKR